MIPFIFSVIIIAVVLIGGVCGALFYYWENGPQSTDYDLGYFNRRAHGQAAKKAVMTALKLEKQQRKEAEKQAIAHEGRKLLEKSL